MSELPPFWREAKSANGRIYYYNTQTRQTTWQRPVDIPPPPLDEDIPAPPTEVYKSAPVAMKQPEPVKVQPPKASPVIVAPLKQNDPKPPPAPAVVSPPPSTSAFTVLKSTPKEENKKVIEKPLDKPPEKPIEKPLEKPPEKPIEKPLEKPPEKPLEKKVTSPSTTENTASSRAKTIRISANLKSDGSVVDITAGQSKFTMESNREYNSNSPNMEDHLLATLASGLSSTARDIGKRMSFSPFSIVFQLSGEYGQQNPYFQKIKLRALVDTTENEGRLAELQRIVQEECPVFCLMKAAGVEIDSKWEC